jgi:hypothetical protein
MWRTMRMAVCALAATLALSGFALAQRDRNDDDGYYRQGYSDQAQQYGYQNGFNEGVRKGQHEGRERDPNDYGTPSWRHSKRGYQRWMGSVELYQRAYQQGYRNGFRSGYEEVSRNWSGGYRGNAWQGNGWQTGYDRDGSDIANRFGYEDGAQAAREDIYNRKEYNSNPRGRFGDRDHGYRREFGSRDRYKAEYTAGYRSGYDSVMRRRY